MAELPRLIRPMLASLRRDLPDDADRYGWELKWDGVRTVAYVRPSGVRLMSRNDKDMTGSYPELAALGDMVGAPAVLDGEIVAFADGRPDFGRLQARMHVRRPSGRLLAAVPICYYVFDVLHVEGESLLAEPYVRRRARLEALGLGAGPVHTPPWWAGAAAAVHGASIEQGLEGIVGKPLRSRYHPGRRRDWIKIKNVRHHDVVIGGWTPGGGRRRNMIGSLLLGVFDDHGLVYIGNVGTGFTEAMLADLAARLAPLARPATPFDTDVPPEVSRAARWVDPDLVGEVAYLQWTPDGYLRHPSWRGLRPDKHAENVRLGSDEPWL
ncbi:MAG TPA: non-homologous end-joining DNA ligase [Streptosporangiaceae bacterium]|nr:non-homologous end-joining DNA ligase [Streptosporangiaceae bacterium]